MPNFKVSDAFKELAEPALRRLLALSYDAPTRRSNMKLVIQ
jgi:hypothetical protein